MRAAVVLALASGCYTPTPHERLACSETQHCPATQSCDAVFHECASFPICKPPGISDRFDTNDPCGSWGQTFGAAGVDVKDGHLVMTPTPHATGGGCRSDNTVPFGPEGMFIEIAKAAETGSTVMSLNTSVVSIGIDADGRTLFVGGQVPGGGSIAYVPEQMHWWRVRPVADGVLGEYSGDGVDWHALGTPIDVDLGQLEMVSIDLVVTSDSDTPDASELASVGVCPDGSQEP